MNRRIRKCGAAIAVGAFVLVASLPAPGQTVITLTQAGCQFLESENGVDHGFVTTQKSDWEAINERTAPERLAKSRTLELEPGKYIFRVANKSVPYDLGFWS